jgi:hypothetical protein
VLRAGAGLDPAELPSEFQLFWPGENPSTKGSVWFDEVSALRVMADADTYKNEYPIDLEHRMVSPRIVDATDTDTDAMAWHRIEVRAGGLWAVGVSWTPEGERRLRARSQRYTSPAFYVETDPDTGRDRVVRYVNCALCARPATHDIPPLVATDVLKLDTRTHSGYAPASMSKDRTAMAAALASLDAGDATGAQASLRAALEAPEDDKAEGEAPKDDAPPPEPEDEEYTRARGELIALAGDGVSDVPGALRVLSKRARDLTGAADLRGASTFMSTVLAERTARETAELRALVTELVSLKAETPATAWANGAPVPRLLSEGLPALRLRVAALRTARPTDVVPPATPVVDELTPAERAQADKIPAGPQRDKFIALRMHRKSSAA